MWELLGARRGCRVTDARSDSGNGQRRLCQRRSADGGMFFFFIVSGRSALGLPAAWTRCFTGLQAQRTSSFIRTFGRERTLISLAWG